jgi:hypothetical protein
MRYFWIISTIIILALPFYAVSAPVEEPESVEEPDAMDNGDLGPPEESQTPPSPSQAETPASQKEGKHALKKSDADKSESREDTEEGVNIAVLRVLNKVTARTQEIEAPIGSVMRAGTIEIIAHTCWKSAPEERPENAALLEISEIKQGEAPKQIFLGWMYSSSPGLSALEHPFYDVTVVACEKKALKD